MKFSLKWILVLHSKPALNTGCFVTIQQAYIWIFQLISWEESCVCVHVSLVTSIIYKFQLCAVVSVIKEAKSCWLYTIPSSKLDGKGFRQISMNKQMKFLLVSRDELCICVHVSLFAWGWLLGTNVWILFHSKPKTECRMFWKHCNQQCDV